MQPLAFNQRLRLHAYYEILMKPSSTLRHFLAEHPELTHGIDVYSKEQKCYLFNRNEKLIKSYPISTSKNWLSNQCGSYGTPTGLHIISECIGEGEAKGCRFIGRTPTGEISHIDYSAPKSPVDGDHILSRILWLKGLEENVNLGEDCDSHERYIYFHGTNEEYLIGTAASHGCIRMTNDDIIEMFPLIEVGTPVYIN